MNLIASKHKADLAAQWEADRDQILGIVSQPRNEDQIRMVYSVGYNQGAISATKAIIESLETNANKPTIPPVRGVFQKVRALYQGLRGTPTKPTSDPTDAGSKPEHGGSTPS